MIPATTGGLDREQVRQVILNIGRPLPRRPSVLADLMGAARLVPRRTLMLMVLLGLVILLGLTARAEPVQKGQGGVGATADNPLRDQTNFFGPGTLSPLYNFFQFFPDAGTAPSPAPAPAPRPLRQAPDPHEPTRLLTALALIALVILWIHLRSTRVEHPAPRRRTPR